MRSTHPLARTYSRQIWREIDTQNRLTRLLALLEGCIAFIVSGSGHLLEGDVLLEQYILGTLLMDPKKWEEVGPHYVKSTHSSK
jgi:hypothetical protein